MLAESKPDIVEIARCEGMEIFRSGSRYKTACPFHGEKTPSLFFFPDNRFYCFGCGERGDVIDLIRKLHGLNFPNACHHLGIYTGHLDQTAKQRIEENRRRRERETKYRQYVAYVSAVLCDRVVTYGRILKRLNYKTLNLLGHYLHQVQIWEHWLDIIVDPLSDPDDVKAVNIAYRNQESQNVVRKTQRRYSKDITLRTG